MSDSIQFEPKSGRFWLVVDKRPICTLHDGSELMYNGRRCLFELSEDGHRWWITPVEES